MSTTPTPPLPRLEETRLETVLLQELAAVPASLLPGVDGMTNDVMLHDYSRWAQQGAVPAPQQLAGQYPELAAQLRAFFGCQA